MPDELSGPLATTPEAPTTRKRGRPKGTTKKALAAKNAPTVVPAELDDDKAAVEWARAVMWAAEHIRVSKITKRKAGNAMRYTYWQLGQDNQKQLLVDLVPKALMILDKNKGEGDQSGVVLAEQKNINDLKALLERVLEEMRAASE